MRTLSSKYTFFYKYIFILVWIIGFGTGTREVLFYSPEYDLKWLQYAVTWIGIGLFIYFVTGSIKRVEIDQNLKKLVISNYLTTATVDFAAIRDIDGSTLLSPKLVWFIVEPPSGLGGKIPFMPATRPTRGIGKHPMVIELRQEFQLDK